MYGHAGSPPSCNPPSHRGNNHLIRLGNQITNVLYTLIVLIDDGEYGRNQSKHDVASSCGY